MSSPDRKKRKLVDDSADTPNEWKKLLSGAYTPEYASSPVETPAFTPTSVTPAKETPFALPTPRAPSTIKTPAQTPAQTPMPDATPVSSTLLQSEASPYGSTRALTPFTPTDNIKDVPAIPLNFRKLFITAFQVYEEETLIKLENKQVKTHMSNMLDGMKQKAAAKGDKLVLKLKELLDYIPKTYHDWTRSTMQKMFHRKYVQNRPLVLNPF